MTKQWSNAISTSLFCRNKFLKFIYWLFHLFTLAIISPMFALSYTCIFYISFPCSKHQSTFPLTSKHLSATQWTQTSLRRFQDFWKSFMTKPDVATAPGRRCRIYDVLKTSDLRSLEEVWFYDVLKTSDLRRLEDVCKTMSV